MTDEAMKFLERNWWVPLVRGIAAILFGIAAFVWPSLTVAVLVLLFGAYVLVDGVIGVIDAIAIATGSTTGDGGCWTVCWASSWAR